MTRARRAQEIGRDIRISARRLALAGQLSSVTAQRDGAAGISSCVPAALTPAELKRPADQQKAGNACLSRERPVEIRIRYVFDTYLLTERMGMREMLLHMVARR